MLVTGGIDTSTALIAHGLRFLSAHHDAAARLRANPDLIPGAVDEMLRYFSPGTGIARTGSARGCTVAWGVSWRRARWRSCSARS